jgi:putative transposase
MKCRELIVEYRDSIPLNTMCDALKYPRASLYRALTIENTKPPSQVKRRSHRALSVEEETIILSLLNSPRFRDMAPAEIYATMLDEGRYYCSVRTMYRILAKHGQSTQRRQANARSYARPELLAIRPNELWSWDITKLKGPAKWQYFLLYTIIDVYSRYIVGWLIADRESEVIACELMTETILRQEILPGTMTIHADNGASMKSNSLAQLLTNLSVKKTHSRPHVSNDHPYSESAFKTLKYRPDFPDRFGCIQDARAHCRRFVRWYNSQHHHSGISMFTPEQVHYGTWKEVLIKREMVLNEAVKMHPERFVKGVPEVKSAPNAVWINKPIIETLKITEECLT